ncbi:unnamed protein product [Pocillopora meandrina]|uniref:Uncharacterized protein n=1 Tax=Pocillopora meandrina TaxID=46732 RepID=A0AAU9X0U4_9CNID|nr:unnamed protein product [Pocillopora meandrina]
MASANMNSLQKVFGDNILTCNKTCEFHFKESRNIVARKLNDGNGKNAPKMSMAKVMHTG